MVDDLVTDRPHHLERRQRPNRVYNYVAVDPDKVLRVKNAVFILSCRVHNLGRIYLVLVRDLFAKGVLDCRIVALDKMPVYKPDRQRRFAYG